MNLRTKWSLLQEYHPTEAQRRSRIDSADAEVKTEIPVVCSKLCIGSVIVPTCTADNHKSTVDYDITRCADDRFIVLDSRAFMWLYSGLGFKASLLTKKKSILKKMNKS